MRNHDKMILYKPQSASLNSLRVVFLYRHSLVRQRVALTNYGIAPFERQSGSSVYSMPHVSPFANRMIKSLLSQAALAAVKSDSNMSCYYQHLIERGKHPLLIHNNVKNKMLHTLVAMVRNKQKYNPEYLYKPVCGVA